MPTETLRDFDTVS